MPRQGSGESFDDGSTEVDSPPISEDFKKNSIIEEEEQL